MFPSISASCLGSIFCLLFLLPFCAPFPILFILFVSFSLLLGLFLLRFRHGLRGRIHGAGRGLLLLLRRPCIGSSLGLCDSMLLLLLVLGVVLIEVVVLLVLFVYLDIHTRIIYVLCINILYEVKQHSPSMI